MSGSACSTMTAFTIQVPCGMPSDLRVLLRVRTQDHFTAQACAHAVARIAGVDIWTIWHLMCHCLDLMIWIAWHIFCIISHVECHRLLCRHRRGRPMCVCV